jgi:hypothetical protein
VQRACDLCGKLYEAKRSTSRFCEPKHRTAWAKGARPKVDLPAPSDDKPPPPPKPDVGAKLAAEFKQLGVADTYEAGMALWLAGQLDTGTITGTAGVSMSKELDRRVEVLRLKAERPDDPGRAITERFEEKQLRLVEGAL